MAFDLSKARPVEDTPAPKFDISKAVPVDDAPAANRGEYVEHPELMERIGRGFMDVGQGIKQWMLQAGDASRNDPRVREARVRAGQAPDAEPAAPAYTQQVNDEIGNYERGRGPDAGFDGGRMLGNVAATAPLALATGGATLPGQMAAGAAAGALNGAVQFDPTGDSRLQNAAIGGTLGAVAPGVTKAGTKLLSGLGDVGSASLKSARKVAEKAGIKLDAAQQTGSRALSALKDTTANFPFSGAAKAQRAQQSEFNNALARTMGSDLPDGQLTSEVMQNAGKRLGAEFDKISSGKSVDITPKMSQVLRDLSAENNSLKSTTDPKITKMIEDATDDFTSQTPGVNRMMAAEDAQKLRSKLTTKAREAYASGEYNLSAAFKKVRNAVDDSIYDTLSPAEKQAWDTAKKQYGNYKVVGRALSGSAGETGDVSGVQLWNAVKSDVGRDNMSRASSDLSELASLGKDVLKTKTPDSGTAQRMLYQQMFAPAMGMFAGETAGEATGQHRGLAGWSALQPAR
jgi:hypothetical protein